MVREIVPIYGIRSHLQPYIEERIIHKLLADRILVHIRQSALHRLRHHFPVFLCYGQGHIRNHIGIVCRINDQHTVSRHILHLYTFPCMVVPQSAPHQNARDPFGNIHRGIFHHLSQHVARLSGMKQSHNDIGVLFFLYNLHPLTCAGLHFLKMQATP